MCKFFLSVLTYEKTDRREEIKHVDWCYAMNYVYECNMQEVNLLNEKRPNGGQGSRAFLTIPVHLGEGGFYPIRTQGGFLRYLSEVKYFERQNSTDREKSNPLKIILQKENLFSGKFFEIGVSSIRSDQIFFFFFFSSPAENSFCRNSVPFCDDVAVSARFCHGGNLTARSHKD